MDEIKLFSVFALVALLLGASSGAVVAQEPPPPDTPRPREPIITESSGLEWVTMEMEDGEKRVLVPVSSVEASQTARVPQIPLKGSMATKGATSGSAGGVSVTMWRSVEYYQAEETNCHARTGARTQTDECVQKVYVHSKHKYWGPSGGPYWGYDNEGSDWWGCKDDTGEKYGSWGPWDYIFANGTTHQAVAVHEVRVDENPYTWDGPDGKGERGPTVTPNCMP